MNSLHASGTIMPKIGKMSIKSYRLQNKKPSEKPLIKIFRRPFATARHSPYIS
ncbi:hypothetical protein [Neisseria zoodegmatis]|uniref:hypothetical protein n=1 Tax=Neisseria zoodegmatis TaxID=326523 RepID=UPI0026EF8823|nr:hypothetical protein [Neisseria zoodegmatis]